MSSFCSLFTSAIIPQQESKALWSFAERYLNVTDERYKVSDCEGRRYVLKPIEKTRQNWWVKALKVISYCSIIFPLIALVCRSIYRSQKQFEMFVPSSSTAPDVVLASSSVIPSSESVSSNSTLMALTQTIPSVISSSSTVVKTSDVVLASSLPVSYLSQSASSNSNPTSTQTMPSNSPKTVPIKGFEEGSTTVFCHGQPQTIFIRSIRAEDHKEFWAYVKNGSEVEEIGMMRFKRFRISKTTGDYRSENCVITESAFYYFMYGAGKRVPKIYVEKLDSWQNKKYKGVGTALLQAAMEYGYAKRCAGRIDLDACWSSHVFYYKLGMRSIDEKNNKKIKAFDEKGRRLGKKLNTKSLYAVYMHMPNEGIREWQERIRKNPIFSITRANLPPSAV